MRRVFWYITLFLLLWSLVLPPAALARGANSLPLLAQVEPADPTSTPPAAPKVIETKTILDSMTVADKVGQLFLVSFQGNDVSPESDIATLVRDFRVGGVVLLPSNDNYRNAQAPTAAITVTATSDQPLAGTPAQIAALTDALQTLALSAPRDLTAAPAITATQNITTTPAPVLPEAPPEADNRPAEGVTSPRPAQATGAEATTPAGVPLLIALDWVGDDTSFASGRGGFTPLPSAMAVGATWSPQLAEQVGAVMGQELEEAGINLVLGPTLDVLDVPRPGNKGDLDTRTFGGDPFWVGQIGQALESPCLGAPPPLEEHRGEAEEEIARGRPIGVV